MPRVPPRSRPHPDRPRRRPTRRGRTPRSARPRPASPTSKPIEPPRAKAPRPSPKPPKATAKVADLEPNREDGDGRSLTTATGVRIEDDQNSLRAGVRGPSLLEDFHLREKITHFDHERIPERVVHARGAGAHGFFQVYEPLGEVTQRGLPERPRAAHAGLRALLHRRRLPRLHRPRARRARLRGEVLHRGGELRPRRQQHPRLLHPGRDQVPRPRPRGEARAAQRDAAGGVGARHLLGLHLADARVDAHGHVGHVRPRHPAQLPDDGGLRRPHLPLRQRRAASRAS